MDNFYWPPFHDAVTNLFNDNNLYGMIAVADTGRAAADAFERPEAFAGKTIGLAGDLISLGDMKKVWKDVTGKGLGGGAPPELPKPFMDTMVVSSSSCLDERGLMVEQFYGDVKPDADVEANRKMFPGVMDFKTWLSATPMAK